MNSHQLVALLTYICMAAMVLVIPARSGGLPDENATAGCPIFYRQLNGTTFTALLVGCKLHLLDLKKDTLESVLEIIELKIRGQQSKSDLIEEINESIFNDLEIRPISCIYLDLGPRSESLVGSAMPMLEVSSESVDAVVFGGAERLTLLGKYEVALIVEVLEGVVDEQGIRLLGKEGTIEYRQYLSKRINEILGAPVVDDVFLRRYVVSEPN